MVPLSVQRVRCPPLHLSECHHHYHHHHHLRHHFHHLHLHHHHHHHQQQPPWPHLWERLVPPSSPGHRVSPWCPGPLLAHLRSTKNCTQSKVQNSLAPKVKYKHHRNTIVIITVTGLYKIIQPTDISSCWRWHSLWDAMPGMSLGSKRHPKQILSGTLTKLNH